MFNSFLPWSCRNHGKLQSSTISEQNIWNIPFPHRASSVIQSCSEENKRRKGLKTTLYEWQTERLKHISLKGTSWELTVMANSSTMRPRKCRPWYAANRETVVSLPTSDARITVYPSASPLHPWKPGYQSHNLQGFVPLLFPRFEKHVIYTQPR